jgi:hypothetical protein
MLKKKRIYVKQYQGKRIRHSAVAFMIHLVSNKFYYGSYFLIHNQFEFIYFTLALPT